MISRMYPNYETPHGREKRYARSFASRRVSVVSVRQSPATSAPYFERREFFHVNALSPLTVTSTVILETEGKKGNGESGKQSGQV